MAKYIELFGASGVGKSATYASLTNLERPSGGWITFDRLYKNLYRKGIKIRYDILMRKLTGPKLPHYKHFYKNETLNRFVEGNPQLIEMLWQTLPVRPKGSNGKDSRIHGFALLLNTFLKVQIINEANLDKFCILDEGIIQRAGYFYNAALPQSFEEQVSVFFDIIKMPDGIVFFDGDFELVLERTLKRKKNMLHDSDLTPEKIEELRLQNIKTKKVCYDILTSKKVPVLYMDARESIQTKSQKIISFINDLKKNR